MRSQKSRPSARVSVSFCSCRRQAASVKGEDFGESLTHHAFPSDAVCGVRAVGGDFLLGARLLASRLFSCDICSSSQELSHKLPFCLVSVQGGPEAMRKRDKGGSMLCMQRLSDVFRAWENVIMFEQFSGRFATRPPELGAE